MSNSGLLARYYDILDDIPAFENALGRPVRRSVWPHLLRIDQNELARILNADGFANAPLPGIPDGLHLRDEGSGLGRHWAYSAGLFNIQEASAMLPALILSPQPGHCRRLSCLRNRVSACWTFAPRREIKPLSWPSPGPQCH